MAEEEVVKLLEEIRDLQKLHVENYKDALRNQQESIEIQRRALRRQRITLLVVSILLVGFLIVLTWATHTAAR